VSPASQKTVRSIVNGTAPGIAEIDVVAHGKRRVGSGIIDRTDGALLTSGALVYAADSVNVVLADGRSAAGTVAGSDPTSGLAVVRIQLKGLTVAPTDDTSLHPGDRAILVAGPVSAGDQPWVSSGVVSAVNRQVVVGDNTLSDMIETDHPVPPTADGGALVGANGISGVCLVVPKGDDPTAGYAVPIDIATSVASDLLTYGRARHAWMGVEGDDLSSAASRKLGVAGGAVISAIEPQGPAAAAGLVTGDVVVQVGATDVRSMDDLRDVLPAYRPDDEVVLTILRHGNRMTFTVTLGNRP
jgi:S1-C subfamily serine protease